MRSMMVAGNLAPNHDDSAALGSVGRYAVIDIGSNSIRLVIFDQLSRGLSVIFNEKVLCGLGSGLSATGCLNVKGVEQALKNLSRFTSILHEMQVDKIDVVATAAVRDAKDRTQFIERVLEECKLKIRVLSGKEECQYSAYGVLSSVSDPSGLVGDLGGGSLELVRLSNGCIRDCYTLSLGPLRLSDQKIKPDSDQTIHIEEVYDDIVRTPLQSGETFFLVGGNWRSLARLHMSQSNYPLRVIHQYTMTYREIFDFALLVSKQSPKSLSGISDISKRRLELLPLAASVLLVLLQRICPKEVVFCGTGIREGLAYSRLHPQEKMKDPVISVCRELASRVARFPSHGDELASWTSLIFENEQQDQARLRHAACLLSDIAWRVHPDHRAEYALMKALWLQASIDHPSRTFLGLATMYRYSGKKVPELATQVMHLLEEDTLDRAKAVGLAARVGETLCGGVPGVLQRFSLTKTENKLILKHNMEDAPMIGHVVWARFRALALHMLLKPFVQQFD